MSLQIVELLSEEEVRYIAAHALRCECGHLLLLHDTLSCLLCGCVLDLGCGC